MGQVVFTPPGYAVKVSSILFVSTLSSALVLSSVAMYLLRIMIPPQRCHHHHHHHAPRDCAPWRSFLMEQSRFFSVADVCGHVRVFGASFSFLEAHLEVLFVLVAMLSSLYRHDSPGPLRHHVLPNLWACYLTDGLGCLHALGEALPCSS